MSRGPTRLMCALEQAPVRARLFTLFRLLRARLFTPWQRYITVPDCGSMPIPPVELDQRIQHVEQCAWVQ